MGAGKTVVALMAAMELLADWHIRRVLVIAPKKVCESVWAKEHLKWAGCEYMSVAVATGDANQRASAVERESDILVVNYENVAWLFKTYADKHGCDGLILDELTRLKSAGSRAVKILRRRVHAFKWRVGMTGTPVSEDYQGLYSQTLLLDDGKALGTRKDMFLETYFYALDFEQRKWALRPNAAEAIADKIKPLVYTLPDYRHKLPPIIYHEIKVKLPETAQRIYKALKKDFIVEIGREEISAANSAVLTGKLAQVSSGFLYDTEQATSTVLHDAKIAALEQLLTHVKKPVLIAYWYQYDLDAIKAVTGYPALADVKTQSKLIKTVNAWNAGELDGLLIHPRSAGHGLNLAEGGSTIIWYSPQWSRDLWEQTNARLWRTGQRDTVNVYTLSGEGTIDELIINRVESKSEYDKLLSEHLKA